MNIQWAKAASREVVGIMRLSTLVNHALSWKYNEINKKLMKVTAQGNQHEKKGKGFGNGK